MDRDFFQDKFIFFNGENKNDFFYDSVIYLCEHNQDGAFGFIVNKPSAISESQLLSKLNLKKPKQLESIFRVMIGGPVAMDSIYALHDEELIKDESSLLREGLWLSTSQKVLNKIDIQDTANHKIFLGYSGWGPEQLEKEIQDGAWHVCDVDFELIFNDKPSAIIEELSKKVGYNIKSIINQNKVQ